MNSTDNADVILLWIASPPCVIFVLLYGTLQPWFRSWWGWALFATNASLALLLSEALLYRLFGWSILARTGWLRTALYATTGLGTWLTLIALLVVLRRARRELREPVDSIP